MAAEAVAVPRATAEAEEAANDGLPDFIQELFFPSNLTSFREAMPGGELEVRLFTAPGEPPRDIQLSGLFPFFTLQDVKLALYVELGKAEWALPEYLYLCIPGAEVGKTFIGRQVAPVDFTWNLPAVSSKAPFLSKTPFELARSEGGGDKRFVDSAGGRRLVELVQRERITLEDAFLRPNGIGRGLPILHAYAYKDVLAAVPGARPLSEKDWNGKLYPYFPFLGVTADTPTDTQKERAKRFATLFERKQQFLNKLELILAEDTPLLGLTLASIKRLQLAWPRPAQFAGIEAAFYEAPVIERRPFMRLIPVEGSAISKVFLRDGQPDLADPKALLQWATEENPTPERDFAFSKILVRRGSPTTPSFYTTLRLFDDGTADAVLEPPKGVRKMEPRTDLARFGEILVEGIDAFPHLKSMPDVGGADVVLGLRLQRDANAAISPRLLRQRLPIFSALFQEIPALPGESPLAMLRYKLVSNFVREDRIQSFISQVMARKVIKGDALLANLVELVADEFQLDIDEARRKVAQKLQNQSEVALIVPEVRTYKKQYVPGIDIAIFAQHPFYTFHLYNVNSLEALRLVMTALSILMSVPMEALQVAEKSVRDLVRAEEGVALAPGASVEEGVAAAAAAAAAAEEAPAVTVAPAVPAAPAEPEEVVPPVEGNAENLAGADALPDYLDYFMGDAGEEAAEANAAEEAANASKREGPPFSDQAPAVETPADAAAPAADPAAGPVNAKQLRAAAAAAAEAPSVALAAAAPATAPAANSEDENVGGPATGKKSIANYFLRRLHEADKRLFDYSKTHPSAKRYVSQCQPTFGRQPTVLSEEKFQQMREEYARDGVIFHVYPLMPGEPDKPAGEIERDYFTVLRYGSEPQKQNYYICCRYFCIRDEIMVREVDLESTSMRRGGVTQVDGSVAYPRKAPGECPFCRGRVIQNQRAPAANETILERRTAQKGSRRHLYVKFLGKATHPEGFYLPCCFLDEDPVVRFHGNPAFDKLRDWGIPPKPAALMPAGASGAQRLAEEGENEAPSEDEGDGQSAAAGPRTEAGVPRIDYYATLTGIAKKYIMDEKKLPLEIGGPTAARGEPQIGLLPKGINDYFDQERTEIAGRSFNPQKLKPGVTAFLRIGVENRMRYKGDSLLSALAPYFMLNTAEQMKAYLLERIPPKVFIHLNYGNFLLEFYKNAAELMAKFRSKEELEAAVREWSESNLSVSYQAENAAALTRAYLAYMGFEAWLKSNKTKKEFRHFALLLAQSGILSRVSTRGITFIVLDITKDEKLEIRCPPYGFNAELMARNDVAFLFHHWTGIWEPIFYADNRTPEEGGADPFFLRFKGATSGTWPTIVKRRFQEYMAQCSSGGRAIYTSQSQVPQKASIPLAQSMIPIGVAKRLLPKDGRLFIEGVLRDAYNHLAALLVRVKRKEGGEFIPGSFPLPIADDGELMFDKKLVMDWDDPEFEPAAVDRTLLFYKEFVEPNFGLYPGYSPVRLVESKARGGLVAIQLRNGLYVPCGPPSSEEMAAKMATLPKVLVDDMEWSINHEIVLGESEVGMLGEEARLEAVEFQEVFEHFRLTFANWLAVKEEGGKLREVLEATIFNHKLPLFEKRKRLEILLGSEVESWLTTEGGVEGEPSLLRVDCRIRGESACSGRCSWNAGAGRCALHVPETVAMGVEPAAAGEEGLVERRVPAARVLLLRLIDELLRYGERRRQLLEQDVSRLAMIEKPITIGNQRIYPEKSAAWYELLRLEWAMEVEEKPIFVEEMAGTRTAAAAAGATAPAPPAAAVAPLDPRTALPPSLETVLHGGETVDPKTGLLRLAPAPLSNLLVPLGLAPRQLGLDTTATSFSDDQLRELTRLTGRVVVQIDLRPAEGPRSVAKKPFRVVYPTVPVFILQDSGAALLVVDPTAPSFLAHEQMPKGLLRIVDSAKGVLGVRIGQPAVEAAEVEEAAAVAAAPAALAEATVAPRAMTLAERRATKSKV